MTLLQGLVQILTRKKPFKDVFYYFQGNFRMKLYYSKHFKFLIAPHIREQIHYRLVWADQTCINQGSCKLCGCETPQLQMCNKTCEGLCYPPMLSKTQWSSFQAGICVPWTHIIEARAGNKCWVSDGAIELQKRPRYLEYKGQYYVQIN
jgi:hypothetical protein